MYVAGMIIEGMQSEGGDNHASPAFFAGVQAIAKSVSFTACISTKMENKGGDY